MVITRDVAKDILSSLFSNLSDKELYDACEEYGCAVVDLFPTVDELLLAVEEGETTID